MITHKSMSTELGHRPSGRWLGIVLIKPKTPSNIGSVLRLAVNYNASAVFLVDAKHKKYNTDTFNAAKNLPIIPLSYEQYANLHIPEATEVYVDFSEKAIDLRKFQHPKRALYVFGPEDGTLLPPDNAQVVYVPTIGSLNLAISVATVLYDRVLKEVLSHDN